MPWDSQWGGVPCQVQPGGSTLPGPAGGTLVGGTLPGGTLLGVPCLGEEGVPCWGYPAEGYPARGGTLPGNPPGQVRMEGGTQLGQQKEYSLHPGGMPLAFTQEDFLVIIVFL